MTVLIREELNDADLAWAAADPAMASAVGQLLQARQSAGLPSPARPRIAAPDAVRPGPAELRARGAL